MNIYATYNKLTLWNKVTVWGSIVSIIGVPLAIIFWLFPYSKSPTMKTLPMPALLEKDKGQSQEKKGSNNTATISNPTPVVEIFADREKVLHIKNLGPVDISDIQIFITGYKLKAHIDERNHFILDGEIESTSSASDPLAKCMSISQKGGEYVLDLTKVFPNAIPFFSFEELVNLDPQRRFDYDRTVYCVRILLRNDITKQRYVHYLLTNALKQFVDPWNPSNPGAGGYKATMGLSRLRDLIKITKGQSMMIRLPTSYKKDTSGPPNGTYA